jgi:hypothetical protein
VQTAVSDGSWIEVTAKLFRLTKSSEGKWVAFDGTEAVVDGDLSLVSDGQALTVDGGN